MDRPTPVDLIRRALVARHPLIALATPEEERVEAAVREIAQNTFSQPAAVYTWRRSTGLVGPEGAIPETADPLAALDHVANGEGTALYVFEDLQPFLKDVAVVRCLRDLCRSLAGRLRFLLMVSPAVQLPLELKRDVALVDFPLPAPEELGALLDRQLGSKKPPIEIAPDKRRQLVTALQGLTANEARHALNRALFNKAEVGPDVLHSLYEQKEQLARKEGVLEFVPQRWNINDVGGLDVLKDWLSKRHRLFEDDSPAAQGLIPRGLLIMGISGCGKSLSVKAVSSLWNLPLFRLDMGHVFSGVHGSPEESFHRALKMMGDVAPAILWIDEIENGISAQTTGADAGTKGRIFGTFLTWMQEKSSKIFVAATANRIDLLPAELLRKGRFDQVFFIDLPTEYERAQIFAVHLYKRGVDPKGFDLTVLAKGTKNWNGAEIEQCVVSALIEAYDRGETVGEDDLFVQIGKIVPLATTMAEQIKAIKSWAHDRAIKASRAV